MIGNLLPSAASILLCCLRRQSLRIRTRISFGDHHSTFQNRDLRDWVSWGVRAEPAPLRPPSVYRSPVHRRKGRQRQEAWPGLQVLQQEPFPAEDGAQQSPQPRSGTGRSTRLWPSSRRPQHPAPALIPGTLPKGTCAHNSHVPWGPCSCILSVRPAGMRALDTS